ncbi:helix-turn-helix domain-containing protein [Pseudopedobacter beijingensis]|uniref:Helix-turn-helix domain-containing protein n=1 Tax=Pseudopedobacter beijingensis TaxID=1207056 RepID=A0ABW4IGQ3_9SPHI
MTKQPDKLGKYYYTDPARNSQYSVINILLLFGMLGYFVAYLLASIFTINSYLKKLNARYTKIESIRLKWLRDLIILLVIFSFLLSPTVLIVGDAHISSLVLGYFSTLIYFIIVYKSLKTSVIFTHDLTLIDNQPEEKTRYTNSVQTEQRVKEYGQMIEDFLHHNPLLYHESLNLKQMASELNIPPYLLSEIINRYFQKSFVDVINSARIEKAKQELLIIDTLNITIEGIGYNCGFGSKAAFYRAFKKVTGLTPSAFLNKETTKSP